MARAVKLRLSNLIGAANTYYDMYDQNGNIIFNNVFGASLSTAVTYSIPDTSYRFTVAKNPVFDSDASTFISAANITDSTQKMAVNTLVISAKNNGWWSACLAVYPFVGGSSFSHQFNLKDPRDLDSSYRLTFTGSFTHSGTGIQGDGTTAWAQTYFVPDGYLTMSSTSLSFYSRTSSPGRFQAMFAGSFNATSNDRLYFYHNWTNSSSFFDCYGVNGGFRATSDPVGSRGFFLGSRISLTDSRIYYNGNLSGAIQTTLMSNPILSYRLEMFRQNNGTNYNINEIGFATIGHGIESGTASLMYQDVLAFQRNLGRV